MSPETTQTQQVDVIGDQLQVNGQVIPGIHCAQSGSDSYMLTLAHSVKATSSYPPAFQVTRAELQRWAPLLSYFAAQASASTKGFAAAGGSSETPST